jgi:hypothetical protein
MANMGNVIVGFYYMLLLAAASDGTPTSLTANEHPWGRFLPTSWCIVRTVTLSNIDGRTVQSTRTQKIVLQSVDKNGVTLQETETLELGGSVVTKQPQNVKYDFFNEPIQDKVQIRSEPSVKLMIDKKVVPCAVRVYEQRTTGGHLTTTIWYTPHVYPYVIRVEKILQSIPEEEGAAKSILRQSVMLVQETAALKGLRNNRRNRTYTQQTEETVGNITRITDARCSWDVPGGLLESTTRELDSQNREIRRSVSRMTNYASHEAFAVQQPYQPVWVVPVIPAETGQ